MNIGLETETIEFKRSTSELKEAIISISSILNKHGSGVLYFGVKDSGDVIGQTIGKETLRDISRSISGNIKPLCYFEINKQSTIENIQFIEVFFSGNDAPYSAFGKYYQRFADEDKAINDNELERLFKQRMKDYSGWEKGQSWETLKDVDLNLLKRIMKDGNESGHLRYVYAKKDEAVKRLGLLTKEGKYLNNAGRVLLSKNNPIMLKTATFSSETKSKFLKLDHFEGNIFECIERGIEYIAGELNYTIDFDGSSKRKEEAEIPLSAVREIVVNAFAHANYDSNTAFEIGVYKNRVSIYSPGHFPRGFTPEDFALGKEKPIMLNPRIVDVLFRAGRIESFGSGFERVFAECRKHQVKFDYNDTKSGFEFNFYRPLGHENAEDLSKTEKEVLDRIKNNPFATAKEIAGLIGKSEKTVYRAIRKLRETHIIERKGDDYNGTWVVLK